LEEAIPWRGCQLLLVPAAAGSHWQIQAGSGVCSTLTQAALLFISSPCFAGGKCPGAQAHTPAVASLPLTLHRFVSASANHTPAGLGCTGWEHIARFLTCQRIVCCCYCCAGYRRAQTGAGVEAPGFDSWHGDSSRTAADNSSSCRSRGADPTSGAAAAGSGVTVTYQD
jgi:hypothetical protein